MRKSLLIPTLITFLILILSSVSGVALAVDSEPPPAGTNCTAGTTGYQFVERYNPFSPAWLSGHVHGGPPSPRPYHRREVAPGGANLYLSLRTDYEVIRIIIAWESNTSFPSSVDLEAGSYTPTGVTTGGNQMYTPGSGIEASQLAIIGHDSGSTNTSLTIQNLWVCYGEEVSEPPPPEFDWVRPFAEGDEDDWSIFEPADPAYSYPFLIDYPIPMPSEYETTSTNEFTTIAVANRRAVPVMAAFSGTVEVVRQMTLQDCYKIVETSLGQFNQCALLFPPEITSHPETAFFYLHAPGLLPSNPDINIVVIQHPTQDVKMMYVVKFAREHIRQGDVVTAGCILGLSTEIAGPLRSSTPDHRSVTLMTLFDGGGNSVSFLDNLTLYAYPDQACNADPIYANCLNSDPTLLNRNGEWRSVAMWQGAPTATLLEGGGFRLGASQQIQHSRNLNLSEESEYVVTIKYEFEQVGQTTLGVSLGLEYLSLDINSTGAVATIAAQTYAPDADGFYSLFISNNPGGQGVIIKEICISDSEIPPLAQAPACTFANPEFDEFVNWPEFLDNPWNWSNEIVLPVGGGALHAETTDGVISQQVILAAGTYLLTVEVDLLSTDGSLIVPADGTLVLGYDYEDSSFTSLTLASSTANRPPHRYEAEVEVTEDGSYLFEIEIAFSGFSNFDAVRIQRVCLTDEDTPPDVALPYTCRRIEAPSDQLLSSWTEYHWQNLNKFFQCQLMVTLNRMLTIMERAFKLLSDSIRYWIVTAQMSARWLGTDMFPWLAGHFGNMTGQHITVAESGSIGFFDLLIAIVNALRDVLLSVIEALSQFLSETLLAIALRVIDLLFFIVAKIFELLTAGLNFLTTIFDAWNNAEPATLEGLPNCAVNPQANGWCVALWALEHTIFSGPGALIIPILLAVGYANLIIWVVKKIRGLIVIMGNAT